MIYSEKTHLDASVSPAPALSSSRRAAVSVDGSGDGLEGSVVSPTVSRDGAGVATSSLTRLFVGRASAAFLSLTLLLFELPGCCGMGCVTGCICIGNWPYTAESSDRVAHVSLISD